MPKIPVEKVLKQITDPVVRERIKQMFIDLEEFKQAHPNLEQQLKEAIKNKRKYQREIKKNNEEIERSQKRIDELTSRRDDLLAKIALKETITKH